MAQPIGGTEVIPPGTTRLILKPDDPIAPTAFRKYDARTALTKGLTEFLEQVVIDEQGGRQARFRQVLETWAEPEQFANYPAAVVHSEEEGLYDASRFTPRVSRKDQLPPPDSRFLVSFAEYVLNIDIEIWTTDPKHRVDLVNAVEQAFNPVDWLYGIRLELPFYFNQRAEYAPISSVYIDSQEEARKRYRRARLKVAGRLPVTKIVSIPTFALKQRPVIKTVDPNPVPAPDSTWIT